LSSSKKLPVYGSRLAPNENRPQNYLEANTYNDVPYPKNQNNHINPINNPYNTSRGKNDLNALHNHFANEALEVISPQQPGEQSTPGNIQRALEDSFNDCSSLSIFESNRKEVVMPMGNNPIINKAFDFSSKKGSTAAETLRRPSSCHSEVFSPPESEQKKCPPLERNIYQENFGNGPPTFNREYYLATGCTAPNNQQGFNHVEGMNTNRNNNSQSRPNGTNSSAAESKNSNRSYNISSRNQNILEDDRLNNKSGIADGGSNTLRGVSVHQPALEEKDNIGKLISDLELSNREKEAEIFDLNLKLRDLQNEINQMRFRAGRQSRTPVKYSPNSKADFLNEGGQCVEDLNFKRNRTPNPGESAIIFCEQMREEISSIVNKSSFIANNHPTNSNMSFDYEKKTLKSGRFLGANREIDTKGSLYSDFRDFSEISSPVNHEGKPNNLLLDKEKAPKQTPAPFVLKPAGPNPAAIHVDTVQSMKGLLDELDKRKMAGAGGGGDSDFPEENLADDTSVVEEEEDDEMGESTPENFRKKGKNFRKILPKIVHSLKIDDTDCFQNELDIREFAIHHPLTKNIH
jgi:hypothetical protein